MVGPVIATTAGECVDRGCVVNAPIVTDTDEPRLYSRQQRTPVDVIAPQHIEIHVDLERWGAWNRERKQQGTCSSVESEYDSSGGRETKRSTVSLPANPRHGQIDRVVRQMRMRVPQHGETVTLFYAKRRSPLDICHVMLLRFEDLPKWMFDCRAMVINLLRLEGL